MKEVEAVHPYLTEALAADRIKQWQRQAAQERQARWARLGQRGRAQSGHGHPAAAGSPLARTPAAQLKPAGPQPGMSQAGAGMPVAAPTATRHAA